MITPTEKIHLSVLNKYDVDLYVRREDKIHPLLSGNKYRKMKYNLEEAVRLKHNTLLTFGGAFSNHIAATAYGAKKNGLRSIGVIRGEELSTSWKENHTLSTAHEMGMQFHFVSRQEYQNRGNAEYLRSISKKFGPAYVIPEGGTNECGIRGCEEILQPGDEKYSVICVAVGTGGTLAGLSRTARPHQRVLGFPALKGNFLEREIQNFTPFENWSLCTRYHFGGYAKVTLELVTFINDFREETGIPLDPVYTGKMMYGLLDMISSGAFDRGTQILIIHTGGLQGINGMNGILRKKNLPLLTI